MSRTIDPSRLQSQDASAFRELIRQVSQEKGLGREEVADRLDCDVTTYKNLMAEGRPLLAGKAYRILCAVRAHCKQCFERRERNFEQPELECEMPGSRGTEKSFRLLTEYSRSCRWLQEFESTHHTPRISIPEWEIGFFSELLANKIGGVSSIGSKKTERIRNTIEKFLRSPSKNAPPEEEDPVPNFRRLPYYQQMAYCWYQSAATALGLFVAQVSSDQMEWSCRHAPSKDVLELRPDLMAREFVYAATCLMTYGRPPDEAHPKRVDGEAVS